MTAISPSAAYGMWAATYDDDLNPLIELERRVLRGRLSFLPGSCLLDLATGTGRWLEYAVSRGTRALGVDLSPAMLSVAAAKPGVRGRLACADVASLPFAPDSVDVAICSFALGYVDRLQAVFHEVKRVSRTVITSDLHPDAAQSGWSRSFRSGNQAYEINHHAYSRSDIDECARTAGLRLVWSMDAFFGEPERPLFEQAGKSAAFLRARQVPAILISAWERA